MFFRRADVSEWRFFSSSLVRVVYRAKMHVMKGLTYLKSLAISSWCGLSDKFTMISWPIYNRYEVAKP